MLVMIIFTNNNDKETPSQGYFINRFIIVILFLYFYSIVDALIGQALINYPPGHQGIKR
jgi:hypothetical protein